MRKSIAAVLSLASLFAYSSPTYAGSVSANGAYGESIPIVVPPGMPDTTPNFILGYDSNIKNGIIAQGWTIQGTQSITRINNGNGINYNGQDSFTGPGGKLYDVSGSRTLYHFEKENWSKVVPQGQCGDAACWFLVTDRLGNKSFFGQSSSSRLIADGRGGSVRAWHLDRVETAQGYAYTIEYYQHNGQIYPKRVLYTQGLGIMKYRSIDFEYENRSDVETQYEQGSTITTSWRLKSVYVKTNVTNIWLFDLFAADLVRRYDFSFEYSLKTGRSRLTSITEFGSDGVSSLPARTFTYDNSVLTYSTGTFRASTSEHLYNNGLDVSQVRTLTGDFNGDGRTDIATVSRTSGGAIFMELSIPSGFRSETWAAATPQHLVNGGSSMLDFKILTGDFNGDGKTDIATVGRGAGGSGFSSWIAIELSTGSGFISQTWGAGTGLSMAQGGSSAQDFETVAGDFNGDGKTDIATFRRAMLGTGNGFNNWILMEISTGSGFETRAWNASTPTSMAYGGNSITDFRVLVGDFNGDGKADIATLTRGDPATGNGFAYWIAMEISTGTGFSSERWSSGMVQSFPYGGDTIADFKVVAGDFNGDGITDIAGLRRAMPGTGNGFNDWIAVELSTGTGFASQAWTAGIPMNLAYGANSIDEARILAGDFNGDGRTDIAAVVRADPSSANGFARNIYVEYSFGNRFLSSSISSNLGSTIFQRSGSIHEYSIIPGDFSGDGKTDIVALRSGAVTAPWGRNWLSAVVSPAPAPDLLVSSANGIGKSEQITYVSTAQLNLSTIYSCDVAVCGYRLVSSQNVVRVHRSLVGATQTNLVNYTYADPRVYSWGVADRTFLGFQWIAADDSVTRERVESNYEQDPRLAMLVARQFTKRNGTLISSLDVDNRQYKCDEAGCAEDTTMNLKAPKLVRPARTTKLRLDGSVILREISNLTYDSYGNRTRESTIITGNGSATPITKTRVSDYVNSTANPRIIGVQCASREFSGSDDDTGIISSTRLYFDGAATHCSFSDSSSLMRVTKSEQYLGNNLWAPTTMSYDLWGNVVRQTDARGIVTEYDYDPNYRAFPVERRIKSADNNKVFIATMEPNVYFGFAATATDHNGLRMVQTPDAFGRIQGTSIYDGLSEKRRAAISYANGSASFGNHRTECAVNTDNVSEVICSRIYSDALGREIRRIAPAVRDVGADANQSAFTAVVTEYNAQGLVSRKSLPYFVSGLADTTTMPAQWIGNTYDTLGRLRVVRKPFTTGTRSVSYDYNTAPLSGQAVTMAQITDERGRVKQVFLDARGNPVQVNHGVGSAQLMSVSYTYDAKGQLSYVTKADGITTISYENVTGRRLSISDPIAGTTVYTYFSSPGNVRFGQVETETRPAPGGSGTITGVFEYNDALGRLTKKVYGADTTEYFYDSSSVSFGRGKLTGVEHREGGYIVQRKLGYDIFGNQTSVVTDIAHSTETLCADTQALPCHAVNTQTYDSFGRLQESTYADTKVSRIDYVFGRNAVTGIRHDGQVYASYSGYSETGQPGKVAYRNGTSTGFTYESTTGRLKELTTTDGDANTLQDLAYEFYEDGTIKKVDDLLLPAASYTYTYDALNRIQTAARGDGKNLSYAFDGRGNLTQKGDRDILFAGPMTRPDSSVHHRADGDATTSFSWSSAGNMLTRTLTAPNAPTRTVNYSYNSQNKITRATTAGGTFDGAEARSFYDDQGTRFLKTYSQPGRQMVKTWYIGGFEMRESFAGATRATFQMTRYITGIDGQKIASITSAPDSLTMAMTSTYHYQLAQHYNGQFTGPNGSISGFSSHSMHLMVAYTLTVKEYYVAHRRPGLLFLIAFALILTALLFADRRRRGLDFGRRLTALITATAFFSVISCGGSGSSGIPEGTLITELDALYNGLPQGTYFYHSNHLGSSTVVTNSVGVETTRTHYLPYGEIDPALSGRYDQATQTLVQETSASNAFLSIRFTGQDYDPETETYDYKARMYDPVLGSFTTADSIVPDPYDPQAFNRYLYVLGNPIIYTDPSGHSAEELDGEPIVNLRTKDVVVIPEYGDVYIRPAFDTSKYDGFETGGSGSLNENRIAMPASRSVSMPAIAGEGNISFQNANYTPNGSPFGTYGGTGTGKFDPFALPGEGGEGNGDGSALAGRLGASMGKALIAFTAALTVYFAAPVIAGYMMASAPEAAVISGAGGAGGQAIYRNLDRVTAHVRTFGSDVLNEVMLQRLSEGMRTLSDKRFYIHELFESRLMQKGMDYASAHGRALERFGHKTYDLYAPEVVQVLDSLIGSRWMSPAYYKYWGLR